MLLQADGRHILLFPAWPRDWNVDFKLHAPFATTIQGRYRAGKLEFLEVSPKSRRNDLRVLEPAGRSKPLLRSARESRQPHPPPSAASDAAAPLSLIAHFLAHFIDRRLVPRSPRSQTAHWAKAAALVRTIGIWRTTNPHESTRMNVVENFELRSPAVTQANSSLSSIGWRRGRGEEVHHLESPLLRSSPHSYLTGRGRRKMVSAFAIRLQFLEGEHPLTPMTTNPTNRVAWRRRHENVR